MLSLIHEFLVVRTSFIVRDNSSVRNTFQPLMQKAGQRGGPTTDSGNETTCEAEAYLVSGASFVPNPTTHRGPPR